MSINNFVYTNKNSLSDILCNEIINLYEEENDKYEGITGAGVDKNIKDTVDFVINNQTSNVWNEIDKCLKTELQHNLMKYIDILNDDYADVNIKLNTTSKFYFLKNKLLSYNTFLVQRYKKNCGRYIYHDDESVEFKQKRYRLLTYIWYLNTVVEGGETDICASKYQINPECGKLVMFPATWCFPHAGSVPLSSDKYIITGWIYVEEKK